MPDTTLTDLRRDLSEITVYVSYVLDLSVTAWSEAGAGAERVAAADREVGGRCRALVQRIGATHARRPLPYLPDVRSLVAATVAAVAVERTGSLAVEIATRAVQAGRLPADATALTTLTTAGHEVADALGTTASALRSADSESALRAADAGRAAAAFQAEVREAVWARPGVDRTWAAQALLASRCLERAAANAVSLAERMIWVEYGARAQAA